MADRSRRRCVARKAALPDATHYVGYVEDEETPEAIMKKFEEMERIRAGTARRSHTPGPGDAGEAPSDAVAVADATDAVGEAAAPLDHEQLQAIFKATSMYNVKSVLNDNQALRDSSRGALDSSRGSASDGAWSGSDDDLMAELRGFWSDEEWARPAKQSKSKRGRDGGSKAGSSKAAARGRGSALQRNQRTTFVTQYNRDTNAFIRRRARVADPDAILQLRVPPPPLPLSWGRTVRPLQLLQQPDGQQQSAGQEQQLLADMQRLHTAVRGLVGQPPALPASRNCQPSSSGMPGSQACCVHRTPDICAFPFSSLQPVQEFQAVLINTGWEAQPAQPRSRQAQLGQQPRGVPSWGAAGQQGGSSVVERLARLPIPSLCPRGFVMLWISKEHLAAASKQLTAWGFTYVENLTWVLQSPGHAILRLPAAYLQRSHASLYIYRREGEGRDIELRHQRNPDVVFDCVRAVEGLEWDVPAEVFDTIETLLPTGKGAFLELWAPAQAGRAGWTHIVEAAPGPASASPSGQPLGMPGS